MIKYLNFVQGSKQQKPHTRLELVGGILHQKLIFVESPSDVITNPTDCVIFNDGSKSSGCAREEFKPYVSTTLQGILFAVFTIASNSVMVMFIR